MKLDARALPGFMRDPGPCRLVLLFGEDEGQIRERSQALTRVVAGSLNDPFRVVELTREGWGQIPAEMSALSMIGGRRVIVVRDAADGILGQATGALKGSGEALLILEAPGLARGKLRTFAEGHPAAAAVACYPDEGRALTDLVSAGLAEFNVRLDRDALAWLAQSVSGDRAVIRGEVEKLALYAGQGGTLDLDAVRACTGETAVAGADGGVLAALDGRFVLADTGVEAAIQDGMTGVALLRTALSWLQKLHQARLRVEAGDSASEAVRAMRPPVFFRAVQQVTACVELWSGPALLRVIEDCRVAELACKQTGSRPELLARRFVAGLARQAASRRQRRVA